MDKNFGITDIQNYHGLIIVTTNPSGKEIISFQTRDKNGNLIKTNDKEKIFKFLKESGCTDEQIAGIFGDMTQKSYIITPYPGTDIIEIENARKSEIEHWPGDDGIGEFFRHHLAIDEYNMVFTYHIFNKKVLLESCLIEDVRLGFYANAMWETVYPFNFKSSNNFIVQYIPFKSWTEYFSLEPVKNYAISHGAHENFLTEKGMFY